MRALTMNKSGMAEDKSYVLTTQYPVNKYFFLARYSEDVIDDR